jgi:hypothetical protein
MDEKVILYLKEVNNIRKALGISPDDFLELVKESLDENHKYFRICIFKLLKDKYEQFKNY